MKYFTSICVFLLIQFLCCNSSGGSINLVDPEAAFSEAEICIQGHVVSITPWAGNSRPRSTTPPGVMSVMSIRVDEVFKGNQVHAGDVLSVIGLDFLVICESLPGLQKLHDKQRLFLTFRYMGIAFWEGLYGGSNSSAIFYLSQRRTDAVLLQLE